ncbi:hypothetical protein Bca52824_032799 [Brassica carinata]|uniref:Uncharacterized protein n=1 Tax=Brassica carinata TaxID=52824 RepID=A0A8X7SAZ8_BRACI|nr:hypothetical protein Bca52824_032799 [Brassica carinata]
MVRRRSEGYGLQTLRGRIGRMLRARDLPSARSKTFSGVSPCTGLRSLYRRPSRDHGPHRKAISASTSRTSRTTRSCGFRFPGHYKKTQD